MLELADWCAFCKLMETGRHVPHSNAEKEAGEVDWLSPFLLGDYALDQWGRAKRVKENVVGTGRWCGLDIDRGISFDEVRKVFSDHSYLIHNTTNSRVEDERLRLLLELDRELVDEFEHLAVWHAVNDKLGDKVDPSTKDVTRVLYVPAKWTTKWHTAAYERFLWQVGTPLQVDPLVANYRALEGWLDEEVSAPGKRGGTRKMKHRQSSAISVIPGVRREGDLITSGMERSYRASREGGRFFRLMCAMAARCVRHGWEASASRIEKEAVQFDKLASRKTRADTDREAERALAWAKANIEVKSPLALMHRRVVYRMAQSDYKPRALYHRHLFDSSLVKGDWLNAYLNSGDRNVLELIGEMITTNAVVNRFGLHPDHLDTLLDQIAKLKETD